MNKLIVSVFLICIVQYTIAAPTKNIEEKDLSSILNLLPHGSGSTNILNTLGQLTQGTSLSQVMSIIQLLNNLHLLENDLTAIPQDILAALNSTSALINGQLANLTNLLHPTKDLSSILNLLPHGSGSTNILNTLGQLTQGTSLSQVMSIIQLLNNLHLLENDLTAIPQDILAALNSTSALINGQLANLTNLLHPTKDLSSILNLLPHGSGSTNILNTLGQLTQGTSLSQVMSIIQLLNNLHLLENDLTAIPQDILAALNSTSALINGQLANLTNLLHPTKDLSSILNLLPHGSGSTNILNTLGQLTQGTSLSQVMSIIQLLNNLHLLENDLTAIPQDILNALNQASTLITEQLGNISNIITPN